MDCLLKAGSVCMSSAKVKGHGNKSGDETSDPNSQLVGERWDSAVAS